MVHIGTYGYATESVTFESETHCILLIHGFGGSPWDFKPLTDALDSLGVNYHALTLEGHGTTPEDLKDVKHEEWLEQAFGAYDSLSGIYKEVSLVGFSMGGAISLIIASERPVHKLVLISPYFEADRKWYYFGQPEEWAERLSPLLPYIRKLKMGQINNPEGLERYRAYIKVPLKVVSELVQIGEKALEAVPKLHCPVLWMHSRNDIVSNFELSRKAFERIGSTQTTFIEFSRSNHIMLYDYDAEDVIEEVGRFLKHNMK